MRSNVPGDAGPDQAGRGDGADRMETSAARRAVTLRPEHLYKTAGLLFLLLLLHTYFAEIIRVLLIAYAAAIVGIAMNVVVGTFPAQRRIVSVLLGVAIFALLVLAVWIATPILGSQIRGLVGDIPRVQGEIMRLLDRVREITAVDLQLIGSQAASAIEDLLAGPVILGTALGIVEAIFIPLVILVGGLYAVAKPNTRLLSPLLQVIPRERRDDFRRLYATLGERLKGWVRGTLLAMLVVGLLVSAGLWLIGVPYALLLGVVSAVFEIVPILGPWVAGAFAVAVALIEDPSLAIWVALLMLAIQQVESNVITPIMMSQMAEVHPFVTLFSLLLFGAVFGFMGIILAVPLVLLIWTAVEVLWVDRAINAEGDHIEPLVRE